MTKHWVSRAIELLQTSLKPVSHEVNELDWKAGLSPQSGRLAEHLMAFANYPGRKAPNAGNKFAEYLPYWA